jgi:hypothetical protein
MTDACHLNASWICTRACCRWNSSWCGVRAPRAAAFSVQHWCKVCTLVVHACLLQVDFQLVRCLTKQSVIGYQRLQCTTKHAGAAQNCCCNTTVGRTNCRVEFACVISSQTQGMQQQWQQRAMSQLDCSTKSHSVEDQQSDHSGVSKGLDCPMCYCYLLLVY